jgi:hypothetical protein
VKAAVGALGFLVPEEQITLGTYALPTCGAGAQVAGEVGGAGWTAQEDQPWCGSKDRGRGAVLQVPRRAACRAGRGAVEDAALTLRAAAHEQDVTLGAEFGPGRNRKAASRAGKAQHQPAGRTGVFLILLVQGMPAAGAVNLGAVRADAVVVKDTSATVRATESIGSLDNRVGSKQN